MPEGRLAVDLSPNLGDHGPSAGIISRSVLRSFVLPMMSMNPVQLRQSIQCCSLGGWKCHVYKDRLMDVEACNDRFLETTGRCRLSVDFDPDRRDPVNYLLLFKRRIGQVPKLGSTHKATGLQSLCTHKSLVASEVHQQSAEVENIHHSSRATMGESFCFQRPALEAELWSLGS
jgi:hypothetical protein